MTFQIRYFKETETTLHTSRVLHLLSFDDYLMRMAYVTCLKNTNENKQSCGKYS